MPLIIAVIVIIVIFVWAIESNKESGRRNREHSAAARKTNAEMERSLVDKHMKHGKPFREAFQAAREDVQKAGFEPCIPMDAYRLRLGCCTDSEVETSECPHYEQYDSAAVKHLKSDYKSQCEKSGKKWSKEGEYAFVYGSSFPTTAAQYDAYLSRSLRTHQHEAVAVGRYISYYGFGTCEVVSLDFDHAMHTVKVLKTGEIKQIPFGDKNITKL